MLPLIREYDPEDHPMLVGWWKAHGWDAVPQAVLPKFGLIAHMPDGQDVAAGWLYMDNSVGVCWLEWLVTNPAAAPRDCLRGINTLTKFFQARAVAMDYGVMLTTCRQPSLVRVHERNGFQKTDEGVTHLLAILR